VESSNNLANSEDNKEAVDEEEESYGPFTLKAWIARYVNSLYILQILISLLIHFLNFALGEFGISVKKSSKLINFFIVMSLCFPSIDPE